jgi:hypothetical protein
VDNFFQYFEQRTGYEKPEALTIIRLISGYLAKNYKKEFAVITQYFLSQSFDQKDPKTDTRLEWHLKNQNL